MSLIPKYTQIEISKRIQSTIDLSNLDVNEYAIQHCYDITRLQQLLHPTLIWIAKDYQLAAKILHTTPKQLLASLPQEELDSISFRALENTEEINAKVQQLDQIFQLLTYQLKIGSDRRD